jgi:zinc protease
VIKYLFLLSLCFSSQANSKLYSPQSFRLSNGLTVVVLENHQFPVVEHTLWIRAGALDDPAGKSGIAHFLEHMMFKGTKTNPGKKFTRTLEALGASFNAATTDEYTLYTATSHIKDLPTIMNLESDRFQNLMFPDEEIKPERDVIIQERSQRIDNNPGQQLMEGLRRMFYWHHRSGIPTIGWRHEMETLDKSDVFNFYKDWYVPNNAVLVLAGDITIERAKKLSQEYYGNILPRKVPDRSWLQEPPHNNVTGRLTLKSPQVQLPAVIQLYQAPNYRDPRAFSLEVLKYILVGSDTARLIKNLIKDKKILSSIDLYFSEDTKVSPNILSVVLSPLPKISLSHVEIEFAKEIKTLLEQGVTQKELDQAKEQISISFDLLKDDSLSGAKECGESLMYSETLEYLESTPERLNTLTVDDINKAIQLVFSKSPVVTGELVPENPSNKHNLHPSPSLTIRSDLR